MVEMNELSRTCKPADMSPEQHQGFRLMETTAALVAEVFGDIELRNQFEKALKQDPYTEQLHILMDAAADFEAEARKREVFWDDPHDWILCIEELSRQVVAAGGHEHGVDWEEVFDAGV